MEETKKVGTAKTVAEETVVLNLAELETEEVEGEKIKPLWVYFRGKQVETVSNLFGTKNRKSLDAKVNDLVRLLASGKAKVVMTK